MDDMCELQEVFWQESFHQHVHELMLETKYCDTEITTGLTV